MLRRNGPVVKSVESVLRRIQDVGNGGGVVRQSGDGSPH